MWGHISQQPPAGGGRYDENLTSEERKSLNNGIWLCQDCAHLVDADSTRYTTQLLGSWKNGAENEALNGIGGQERVHAAPMEDSAEIEISHLEKNITGSRHDYSLEVILKNQGSGPLQNYFVEIELPTKVIEAPQDLTNFVQSRSNQNSSFFRASFDNPATNIFPGDTKTVMSIPYFMDSSLYDDRNNLFNIIVKATFSREGVQKISVEKEFRDIQNF